jgi:SAM-dependent methyltransferase
MAQDEIFTDGEADAWFERNAFAMKARTDSDRDPILRVLAQYGVRPATALEIGASNGYRMHLMAETIGARCTAIEPSVKAVEDGRSRYPAVKFDVGTASPLPYAAGSFDCVVVCGVFCWLDRSALLQGIAEADRVLKDGGHLIIGDFHPLRPERVRYHHRSDVEVFTYKQDYAAIFRAVNTYELLAAEVFEHGVFEPRPVIPPHERFGVTLLRKDLSSGYLTQDLPDA